MHGGRVVGGAPAVGSADGEAPVVGLPRRPVLEDDHGADLVGALSVGNVVAFDAQGRLGKVEGLGELLQSGRALSEVAGTARLVQAQRLLGVLAHSAHESRFVAAGRHAHIDPGTAQAGEPGAHGGGVGGQDRNKDLARNGGGGGVSDVVNAGGRGPAGPPAYSLGAGAGQGRGGGASAHTE